MFGYPFPDYPYPSTLPTPAPVLLYELRFCHSCGCTYWDACPQGHVTVKVRFAPGRAGFKIDDD
jgi:hypothetical protein